MIGLEYVLKLFEMTQQELADKLEIKQQNIDSWIKRKRNIPKKWLPILAEIFNIPEKYFQKELENLDKEKIQLMKIYKINDEKELGYKDEKCVLDEEYNAQFKNLNKKELYRYNLERQELMSNLGRIIDIEVGASEYYEYTYLHLIVSKKSKISLINKFLQICNDCKDADSEVLEEVLNSFDLFLYKKLSEKYGVAYDEESIKFIYNIRNLIVNEKGRIIKKEEDSRKEADEEREIIDKIGLKEYKRQLFEEYDYELLEQYEEYLLKKNI